MKRLSVFLIVVVTGCVLSSLAFAGDIKMATIKTIDEPSNSFVITVDDKDHLVKADKNMKVSDLKPGAMIEIREDQGLHLGQMKPGDKMEFEMVKDSLMYIKAVNKNNPK
jgi:hypothetical protein